ncbi:MAG: hypothetical protein Q4D98_04190 [Planctomycetia bacterium]|nr:hypothetical protein [Planctomycetia bacterium]
MIGSCLILGLACLVASVWAYQSNRHGYRSYLAQCVTHKKTTMVEEACFFYRRFLRRKKISFLMFCLGWVIMGMGMAVSWRLIAGTVLVYVALFVLGWIMLLAVWDGISSYAYYHGTEARLALRQAKEELRNAMEKVREDHRDQE